MKRNLYLYYLFSFLSSFALFSGVLVPFFTQWGHLTLTQTLLVQSWFTFWLFILEVPTGALADCVSRKFSLIVGALITAVAAFIYGLSPNLYLFLAAEFLFAFGAACNSGANEALLYDTLKSLNKESQSAHYFGRAHSISLLAMLVSAPIGSFIAEKLGLNWPIIFTSIPFFGAAIGALLLKEPPHYSSASESKRYVEVIKEGFAFLAQHSPFKRLAADAIIVAIVTYYIIWLQQPLLESIGIPLEYFGWFHALLLSSEIIVAAQLGKLSSIVGSPQKVMRFTAILTGVAFLLAGLWPNIITIIVFIIVGGGFGLTRLTYATAQLNHLIPSSHRATVISAISMLRRGGNTVTNPIIGRISDLSLSLAFVVLGIIALAIGLISRTSRQIYTDSKN